MRSLVFYVLMMSIIGVLLAGCGQRSVNNNLPVSSDSVPLIVQQKGYSVPPSLVTVDLEEDLPVLNLKIELKEVKFIPLETTPEILIDKDWRIMYQSDQCCVIINRQKGDVFIFNLEGKCISHFNHKGPGPVEYPEIIDVVVDEKAKEIFIANFRRCSALVYAFDGHYKRKFNFPPDTRIFRFFNFNDTTLLASGWPEGKSKENSVLTETPYILLSKQTGNVVIPLNVRIKQRTSFRDGWYSTTSDMLKNGKDIYLSHISSDTLYHIEQDGTLEPFLVRKPSVFGSKPQMFFQITEKYGSYLILIKTINEVIPNSPKGAEFKNESYVLNFETGEISKLGMFKFSSGEGIGDRLALDVLHSPPDMPSNRMVTLFDAHVLIDGVENGDLKSDVIKKIVSSLKEEDNPVLAIYKF